MSGSTWLHATLVVGGSAVTVALCPERCLTEAAGLLSAARRGALLFIRLVDYSGPRKLACEWHGRATGRVGRASRDYMATLGTNGVVGGDA